MRKLFVVLLLIAATAMLFATGSRQSGTALDLTPLKKYDQPVRMSVGRLSNAGGQFAPGQNSENNGYNSLLKEALNIEIDVRNGFDVIPADYDNILALRAASNNLPDTFVIQHNSAGSRSISIFKQLVEGNKLADLTDIYRNAVGGETKKALDAIDTAEILQNMTVNGRLYGVTNEMERYNTALLWIRKDWLDKSGLSVPRTLDDVKNVALEFVRQRPGGQANTIGIALNPSSDGGMFGQWMGILPVFNAVGSYPDIWIRDSAGQVAWGAIQPETRTALGILVDWYQSGALDRSMVTMKNGDEVRDTYIATNACGMIFNAWWDPWVQWNGYAGASVENNQGLEWIPVMAPFNAAGRFEPKNESIQAGGQVVSASYRNPEAVVKAINLFDEVEIFRNPTYEALRQRFIAPLYGITDLRTNSPFGFRLYQPQIRTIAANAIKDYKASGRLVLDPRIDEGSVDYIKGAYNWATNNTMPNWYRTRSDPDTYMWQYVGHFAHDVVGNMYADTERAGTYREKVPAFIGVTDSDAEYGAMLKDLRDTAFLQIITGQRPLSYFDEFVAQWRRLGGDIITREVNAAARR
jgi:putative aldouronate transport system substrate-binding protein